ncbi:hypothetical protein FJ959_22415 [Mesorhizobium sp. B2-2-4]|uniref:hypothetical protein n=1 Tax=unclassified Mesorhizobium TaxID=325217 RepID=UPI001128847A|nr:MULTISPECIES: hypothetical protein [unclassified Mesorhizobium]TPM53284.1 hypothetical protein FJ959_22415 [Mesorhizobium sp. B2-2-4]TPM62072.1 hypothetical protein FJ965_20950 [Mesorhizobium sp. B2-2-1]TPN68443.1 hypothetical protein FJ984_11430 [Mesorhizobium sp. B1-1-3]
MRWTVQTLIDGKMHLRAYCHRSSCNHSQDLDLQLLKAKLGPDAPAMADDLIPKLRCARCGGKAVGLIYSPDPDKVSGMGRSHYAKAKGF